MEMEELARKMVESELQRAQLAAALIQTTDVTEIVMRWLNRVFLLIFKEFRKIIKLCKLLYLKIFQNFIHFQPPAAPLTDETIVEMRFQLSEMRYRAEQNLNLDGKHMKGKQREWE
jgi:hypothetical protein